jgi:polysaccharide pyruvyl transferase WcaK-like protein
MKRKNVFVINHCSHNKGDNSVLEYLSNRLLACEHIKMALSSSSGCLPFWLDSAINVSYWGCGKRFSNKNESLVSKIKRVARNKYLDWYIYPKLLRAYALRNDELALRMIDRYYDKGFKSLLETTELVICTGGHHISSVLDKNAINPQLLDLVAASLKNKKIVLWAQSLGPVHTDKVFVNRAIERMLGSCEKIFYRDKSSKNFISDLKMLQIAEQVDDSVFGLVEINRNILNNVEKHKKLVTLAIYTAGKDGLVDDYLDILTTSLLWLLKMGYRVQLLPMQYRGEAGDERPVLYELIKNTSAYSNSISIIDCDSSPLETIKLVAPSSMVIAHKTHAVVYGLSLAIPTIAISYHPKTTQFMEKFGQAEYAIDEVALSSGVLISKIESIIKNKDAISSNLSRMSTEIGKEVNEKFLSLL